MLPLYKYIHHPSLTMVTGTWVPAGWWRYRLPPYCSMHEGACTAVRGKQWMSDWPSRHMHGQHSHCIT